MIRKSLATAGQRWRAHLTKLTALVFASTMTGTTTGCGSDSGTAPSETPVGVYSLQQIDKKAVPVQVYRGKYYSEVDERYYEDFNVTVHGGTFQLDDSGGYRSTLNYVVIKDGREQVGTLRSWGSYEVQGDEITLRLDTGETGTGIIGKGTVTLFWDIVAKGVDKPYTFTR